MTSVNSFRTPVSGDIPYLPGSLLDPLLSHYFTNRHWKPLRPVTTGGDLLLCSFTSIALPHTLYATGRCRCCGYHSVTPTSIEIPYIGIDCEPLFPSCDSLSTYRRRERTTLTLKVHYIFLEKIILQGGLLDFNRSVCCLGLLGYPLVPAPWHSLSLPPVSIPWLLALDPPHGGRPPLSGEP